jgi:WD40 repeat protein
VCFSSRQPSLPLLQLTGHAAPTNSLDWAPSSPHYIASGSDDSNAFIWDLRASTKEIKGFSPLPFYSGIYLFYFSFIPSALFCVI